MRKASWLISFSVLIIALSAAMAVEEPLISFDFFESNVTEVYNYIAEQAGYNLVLHPEISGTITVKMTDVPWRKALSVVLETMGHEARMDVNTIFIAPVGMAR